MTEVLKRKCKSFFEVEDRKLVIEAVRSVHDIISNGTHLLKAYYLMNFEAEYVDCEKKDMNVDDARAMVIDEDLLGVCCKVVEGTKFQIRKSSIAGTNKKIIYDKVDFCFKSVFPNGITINNALSTSFALDYSIKQAITAYTNNVWMHFPKYIKKLVYCQLLNDGNHIEGNKELKKRAALITNKVLYNLGDEDLGDITMYSYLVPQIGGNRLYDMKKRPWVYLQRMVWINRRIESSFENINPKIRQLYSPLVLASTQIPGHIRLDTSGLAQLLMNQARIAEFVQYYGIEYGVKLNIKNKIDLLSSYAKVTGIQNPSEFEKIQYSCRLWKYLCKFDKYKDVVSTKRSDGSTWVFDNSILTDGVSISFQITKEENYKKKAFHKPKVAKQTTEEKDNFTPIGELNNMKSTRMLAGDPGKRDLIYLTDGIRSLRYTRGMRDDATHKRVRAKHSLSLRNKHIIEGIFGDLIDPSIHDYESVYMSDTCKKSCYFHSFVEYWKRRTVLAASQKVYDFKYFREAKFLVYCKTKSSEAKFFNKVKKTFLPAAKLVNKSDKIPKCAQNTEVPLWMEKSDDSFVHFVKHNLSKDATNIVIGWGNWGRSPNLRGNAPTPGIGLRRRANAIIPTTTIGEAYTSKECPCCQARKLENTPVGTTYVTPKHHLLRCTNDACKCSWWNRNVVGSVNILRRFVDAARTVGDKALHPELYASNLRCPNDKLETL